MPGLKAKNPEEKLIEATLLLDTYGNLLTERQRTFMRLHFEEDLSFSGIAREYDISRQAVHDSVKHALQTLNTLEDALGLVTRAREEAEGRSSVHIGGRQLVERLCDLRSRVAANGAATETEWVCAELTGLVALLGGEPTEEENAEVPGSKGDAPEHGDD